MPRDTPREPKRVRWAARLVEVREIPARPHPHPHSHPHPPVSAGPPPVSAGPPPVSAGPPPGRWDRRQAVAEALARRQR